MLSRLTLCLALLTATALAQPGPQTDRIAPHPNLTLTARLSGHVPAWARPENDRGPLPDATPLRVALVLARSPERQAAFTQLLADQQNPASPSYHHWLTPQQVGDRYGPTQHDLDALSAWLTSRGLTVTDIAPSRVFLHAAAPASTIAAAFSTTLHTYQVDSTTLRAPTVDPSIPAAFASIVASITGLADTPLHPMHRLQSAPAPQSSPLHPEYTTSSTTHYVTPGDFATIFDLKPTYSAGYNGAGQKVAIIGRSRVVTTDISQFETNTGLPANLPNVVIPPSGVDPGITGTGDQSEATLDVIRVIGTAPGVQADLVISGTAGGFNGIYVAAQYNVQTLLDPVMNISFGSCEFYAGPAQVNLWDTLFAQAASEGISVFVSSADSGAATCDTQFAQTPTYQFLSINYICASSYATCVGGTEFADTASPSTYWSSTNSTGLTSALSYIPEGAWNEPSYSGGYYSVAGGGGGASIYIPKPSWQTGTGVPADGARDVPDVSFPAAGHDGYYACYASGGGDCSTGRFEYFYGTSAAAPGMAGVTAILNQKTGASQGNLNQLLYRTAAGTPAAFHDATPASSGVATCSTATPSLCNNSTPGLYSLTGGLAGYALTTGYDQATGLGSLDITNFLNAASARPAALASGKLTLAESATTVTRIQTVTFTATFTSTTTGTPTGTVQFYADTVALGSPVTLVAGVATTAPQTIPAAGSYDITAIYSGDTTFAQTIAPGVSLTVTGLTTAPKISLPPNAYGIDPSVIPVGTSSSLSVTVPAASGSPLPTGIVRFYLSGSGTGSYIATVPLSAGSTTTTYTFSSVPGTYTLTVYYLGDSVYSPAASAPQPLTIQKIQSLAKLSTNGGTIGAGGYQQFIVYLNVTSGSVSSYATGTIQLYANGTALGAPFTLTGNQGEQSILTPTLFSAAGTYTVTAVYSGDSYWQPETSNTLTQTVLSSPASYALNLSTPSLNLTAGASGSDTLTIQPANGFQGTVNLACAVVYNGTATGNIPPTCSLSTASIPVAIFTNVSPVNISIGTLATRSQSTQTRASAARRIAGASLLCALLFLGLPRRSRYRRALSSAALLSAIFVVLSGCGSSGSSASSSPVATPIPGTTAGSYTITVTASTTAAGAPVPTPATLALTVN